MIWDSGSLFDKAAVYFQRSFSSDRDDDWFPLGITMGFEFLARSALAKIHPVLLADPQQGENLLYAFGYSSKKPPRSVPLKTVLHRLTVVVDDFVDDDFKFCTSVIEMRNAEVHSADLPFETFKSTTWLPQLMKNCQTLCEFLDKSLEELIGEEDADAVDEMITGLEERLKSEALQTVANVKTEFSSLAVETRLERIRNANEEVLRIRRLADKIVKCPSCEADALLRGKVVRSLDAIPTEEGVKEKLVIMPSSLECIACGLSLNEHGHLYHLKLGDQYEVSTITDPSDYFGIEFDPEEYFEPDYGND